MQYGEGYAGLRNSGPGRSFLIMKIRGKHIARVRLGRKLHAPSFKVGRYKFTLRYSPNYVGGEGHEGRQFNVEVERRHKSHGSRRQEYSGKSIGSLIRPDHSAASSVLSGNFRNPLRSKYG